MFRNAVKLKEYDLITKNEIIKQSLNCVLSFVVRWGNLYKRDLIANAVGVAATAAAK